MKEGVSKWNEQVEDSSWNVAVKEVRRREHGERCRTILLLLLPFVCLLLRAEAHRNFRRCWELCQKIGTFGKYSWPLNPQVLHLWIQPTVDQKYFSKKFQKVPKSTT